MRRILVLSLLALPCFAQTGIFANSADVGSPARKGQTEFTNGEYRITGGGANIWAKQDQFQFAWRELSGNFTISATLRFVGEGAAHRKAGIMVRQSLSPDATYADVVIHGNGMPALQWRSKSGEDTNAFDLPFDGPGTFRIKLVRTGIKIYLYLDNKEIAHTEVTFSGPVLAGLAVCSHQPDKTDTVIFSDVSIEPQVP